MVTPTRPGNSYRPRIVVVQRGSPSVLEKTVSAVLLGHRARYGSSRTACRYFRKQQDLGGGIAVKVGILEGASRRGAQLDRSRAAAGRWPGRAASIPCHR